MSEQTPQKQELKDKKKDIPSLTAVPKVC